jgi:hypothetical protein
MRQARNLANLEIAIDHVALMPDAHSGFGMPIGGILFADGAVVPYAIGVDIGCGVQLARTNLVWEDDFGPQKLRAVLRGIQRDIPTGFEVHRRAPLTRDRMLELMGVDVPAAVARIATISGVSGANPWQIAGRSRGLGSPIWFRWRTSVRIGPLPGGICPLVITDGHHRSY